MSTAVRVAQVNFSVQVFTGAAALTAPAVLGAAASTTTTVTLTAPAHIGATTPAGPTVRVAGVRFAATPTSAAGALHAAVTLTGTSGTALGAGAGLVAPMNIGVSKPFVRVAAVLFANTTGVLVWNGTAWVQALGTAGLNAPMSMSPAPSVLVQPAGGLAMTAAVALNARVTGTVTASGVLLSSPAVLGTNGSGAGLAQAGLRAPLALTPPAAVVVPKAKRDITLQGSLEPNRFNGTVEPDGFAGAVEVQ